MTPFIQFQQVSKAYGPIRVIENLELVVGKGEFLSLLGPSGSGKTTTLMMLAGFETTTSGTILLEGQRIQGLPPHKRGMGVVFQNYALFPHMTVAENVAFPLDMRKVGRAERDERVAKALERVQLAHLADRKPSQLSGGQQQRVALTRALVFEPKVVLMDEPLGALDKQLREEMQLEIRALHRRLGLTIVFVTHDQGEALTMSDRIAIFDKGRIAQIGSAAEVYDRPANRFVSQFIGETNLLEGKVVARSERTIRVDLGQGLTIEAAAPTAGAVGEAVVVSIRPERIRVGAPGGDGPNAQAAIVQDVVYQGDHLRLHLDVGSQRIVARADRRDVTPTLGAGATLSFAPEDCSVFSA
ncbi:MULTISPECIES: ABC transporter ATP-binding protein [unclassified Aureimonas]|uniref:ABC transporter ATP-binding protein n=1 Tax=unclassified Aureimonas TaxID=2615206 RepID=UPI0007008387|nr:MULTISPECIES: ABC transporter ATP-binding protein [unclassified Aureimonas]KQT55208.1 Fe3+/spermidine/putrescine ABC transporter ATP-binding protein [Aureimonas sp. Leaf427]KQT70998.1 Fe3+/spermidine/putrescine ABC transporter ATP-binding protein [Aureimonas sp. Leaf460]